MRNNAASRFSLVIACGLCACGAEFDSTLVGGSSGAIELAITAPNASARCLEERVKNRVNGREERRRFTLEPGVTQTLELTGVPAGDLELTAIVTDTAEGGFCTGNVTYQANPQQFRLAPGDTAYVSQRLLSRGE